MFHIILFQPEIPPNTGNVIRLCANTGAHLHLIEPLGFKMEDAALKRAGLDYHEWANVSTYPDLNSCLSTLNTRVFAFSTKGAKRYDTVAFEKNDAFLFWPRNTWIARRYSQPIPLPHLAHATPFSQFEFIKQRGRRGV